MDVDEDDDFYAPEESALADPEPRVTEEAAEKPEAEQGDEDLEEGEEEDEAEDDSDDSDIDIITERKDGSKPAPPVQPARYNEIRNIPQRKGSSDLGGKPTASKKEPSKGAKQASGKDLPGVSTSKIKVDGKPIYEPAGKPITQVNIDEDLTENDKPWRRPGTDVSDYFNYGFDEFTWALYASKQDSLRSEYSADKIALNNKKMFEDMNMMMAMGAMPGMIPGAAGAAMPGMEGMTAEMQAMMQQMMAQGGDPSQMDPSAMFGGAAGGAAAQGGQGQGFGGQGGFGQGQNQFGYEGNNNNSNRGAGNFRGRGNRRGQW